VSIYKIGLLAMLNSTFTVFTCMSLFTKHNYRAKK
jgi:hypothetical protein